MTETGFVWVSPPPDKVFPALLKYQQEAIYKGILGIARFRAPQIEAWMKQNAPWTDRTANARQSLFTDIEQLAQQVVITLNHGVDYGYWLEVAHQGDYSIILPALDYWARVIWNDVVALLS